jgi:ElaB/YqjD/DUF883 family membrane-anchored ribosome-binding protein
MDRQEHIKTLEDKGRRLAETFEALRGNARDLRNDLREDTRERVSRLSADAKTAAADLNQGTRRIAERAAADATIAAARGALRVGESATAVDPRRLVRANPWLGLAAAAGTGIALSFLLSGRRRGMTSLRPKAHTAPAPSVGGEHFGHLPEGAPPPNPDAY